MQIANIHQTKTNLSNLIRRAIGGKEVIVARASNSRDTRPRTGGQWRGKLWVAPDFDTPDPQLESQFCDAPLLKPNGHKK